MPRASSVHVRARRSKTQRRGNIIVMTALLMVAMIGMVAFAVDIGYINVTRTEMQTCVDAAAFAGAYDLVDGPSAATASAQSFLSENRVGNRTMTSSNATIETGNWDMSSRVFTASNASPNAIRVLASNNQQPLFFAKVLGKQSFDVSASAIAVYKPRDIAMVLDYSASMAYDSQFRNISLLGQTAIEANLQQIYNELGSPTFGTLTWNPVAYGSTSTSNSSIKSNFHLTNVAYPYPGGSWDEYIDYVQTDSYVNSAGYRCKYGYKTWVNYLMAKRPSNSDTPALTNCSEQPVTALKDAVDVFLAYLTAHDTDDRVSLSIYTSSNGTGVLEQGLTKTFTLVSSKSRGRQAGHYTSGTNISAGMTKARVELQNNARSGAQKMMVLMTDGVVNLPSGNTTSDKNAVIAEAQLAANAKIPIVTIALGAYADTALMQQVADITGGASFIVPGGQPIAQVKSQLEAVFGQVAADRPLQLVQ